jgi:hypothetical protein
LEQPHQGQLSQGQVYRLNLKARRGALRVALAIAHKIRVAAYYMLAKGLGYRGLGEAYLDRIGQNFCSRTGATAWERRVPVHLLRSQQRADMGFLCGTGMATAPPRPGNRSGLDISQTVIAVTGSFGAVFAPAAASPGFCLFFSG